MSFDERVWKACKQIPKGKVSTYKDIAHALGTKAYRAVGQALHRNPDAPRTPCHRVVASDGTLGGFMGKMHSQKKIMLLRKEGVAIQKEKIQEFEKRRFSAFSSLSS